MLDRAKKCRGTILNASYGEDRDGVFKQVIANTKCDHGPYLTRIRFYYDTEGTLPENPDVWVHCSCPLFKFSLETCLAYHGSSEIKESNGRYPRIKNPDMDPYLCKHLVAIMARAKKKKGRNEAKNLEKLRKLRTQWNPERGSEGLEITTLPKRFQSLLKTRLAKPKGQPKPKKPPRQLKKAGRFEQGPGISYVRKRSRYPSTLVESED